MTAQRTKPCDAHPPCRGLALFRDACGVYVCEVCAKHVGLTRCYCGWSESGGDGRRELEDFGEVIDPYDY